MAIFAALLASAGQGRASLIARYTFDEGSGSVAHDSVGAVDGTLSGTAAFTTGGISGGAVQISSGGNGLVNMGDNFDFIGDFSIAVWIQSSPGETNALVPVARHWAGFAKGYFIAVNDVGDGCSSAGKAHMFASYPCSGNSTTSVNDGGWHQLVGVHQGTTNLIYVDGLLESSSISGAALNSVSAPFLVGGIKGPGGSPQSIYSGLVDELSIYDSALTGSDVSALYNSLTAVPEPSTLTLAAAGAILFFLRRR